MDAAVKPKVNPNAPTEETVLEVEHFTDRLFSFSVTRPASFRFRSGEFVMIGLQPEGEKRPILRAYSVASPSWDEKLDFFYVCRKFSLGTKSCLARNPWAR